ncbi:Senescence-associated protein [Trifolium repens]|nr:Senescence-associated protein [Trifolium repens]
MASQNPNHKNSLYPEVIDSNPEASSPFISNPNPTSSSLYPTIEVDDLVEDLFPENTIPSAPPIAAEDLLQEDISPSAPPIAAEDILIKVPGAILHLIDQQYSFELAIGDLTIIRLRQGYNTLAIYARVADEIQWPLAKDEAAVKVDDSHYFFCFCVPKEKCDSDSSDSSDEEKEKEKNRRNKGRRKGDDGSDLLSYGLTIASKGQEDLVKELDEVLKECSNFSVQEVSEKAKKKGEALDGSLAMEISPEDLNTMKEKKELMEERCAAYWTTLAPNVEDYSGTAAKLIAAGSGQLVKGILWCGDVTVDRLKWGNEFIKKRMGPPSQAEISPQTLRRIKRAKKVTKMTESVATGVLTGVVKVSGFFTSSVANSKAGKKFFKLLPGEVVLASFDGFSKLCDAVEVAGKNVMSTSNTVTTEIVHHRYGEEAAKATSEGLDAAGHAVGTAWAAFKIRQAFNPKSVLKSASMAKFAAKAAADEYKAKKSK